jgi:SNF2 family DNA or RNA helicase
MELYAHQRITADFLARTPKAFVTSDPGTGKTASALEGYRKTTTGKKMLVIAPLSIMQPSWGADISRFTEFSYVIAHGDRYKRIHALGSNTDIVITNHDAVKWIAEKPELLAEFSHLVIDEFPAFKNRTSQRSKALKKITSIIPHIWMMSGTPNSNTILDIWYPAFLLDGGRRLGSKFWQFRSQVCEPIQVGPSIAHIQWQDKEGIENDVADLLKDITIRFQFEECIDIPAHSAHTITLPMPRWLNQKYEQFINESYLETEDGPITAINAGVRVKKALQLLSGAIYDNEGGIVKVHDDRYKLIIDLINERQQCIVAFNFRHEREHLTSLADKAGISYGIIDGSVPNKKRTECVEKFQAGELKVIFAHPQSAGHGLTLTRGTSTIWASPTYNAEHYQQFNRRIYRAGQTRKTETIRVAYEGSKEIEVYERLDGKLHRMEDLLNLFQQYSKTA